MVNVVLFIVVYLVLFAGFMITLGSAVSNFVYELLGYDYALHTLASNLFLVLTAIGFVAGIVLVVRSGINRALRYFDLLLDSVSDILAKSDGRSCCPASLRPPLWRSTPSGDVRAERTRCEGRRGSQERAGGVSGA